MNEHNRGEKQKSINEERGERGKERKYKKEMMK